MSVFTLLCCIYISLSYTGSQDYWQSHVRKADLDASKWFLRVVCLWQVGKVPVSCTPIPLEALEYEPPRWSLCLYPFFFHMCYNRRHGLIVCSMQDKDI